MKAETHQELFVFLAKRKNKIKINKQNKIKSNSAKTSAGITETVTHKFIRINYQSYYNNFE